MLLLFILPLTLWVYLPLRASQDPVLNWGDPSNWNSFIFHITGQAYGVYFSPIKESFHRFISHLRFFPSQFSWWILCLGLLTIPIFLWKKRPLFLFFALIFAVNIIHSIRYTIENIQDYYLPSFILVAILIGFGLSFITRLMPKSLKPISIFFLLLFLIPYYTNCFQNNRAKFYFAYDYGINILRPLEENAIIFSYGDYDALPLWYFFYVQKNRVDISHFVFMHLHLDWYINSIKRFYHNLFLSLLSGDPKEKVLDQIVLSNFQKFPIYVGSGVKENRNIIENYFLLPDGSFFKLLSKNIDKDRIKEELINSEPIFSLRRIKEEGFKDRVASKIISNYAATYGERGNLYNGLNLYEKAVTEYKKSLSFNIDYLWADLQFNLALTYLDMKDYIKAEMELKKILKKRPDYKPGYVMMQNLAILYYNQGMFKEASSRFKRVLELDPNNTYAKNMLEECKKMLDKD
jgi:tetratricopeptide (TPR) repeat protein